MRGIIKAVAFDIDGTLYPAYRQSLRLLVRVCIHLPTMLRFSRIRRCFHNECNPVSGDFYYEQARRLAVQTGKDIKAERQRIASLIYVGWEPVYKKITLFRGARDMLSNIRKAGLKTAVLSDFPPESKLRIWNIEHLFDVILGCESIGALKPSIVPFKKLAEALKVEPCHILYVGNKERFDIAGAKNAGMQTALITRFRRKSQADYQFRTYRELEDIVLKQTE